MGRDERVELSAESLRNYGAVFDGDDWMMCLQIEEPLAETSLVVACERGLPARSENLPTGLAASMFETSHGYALQLLLTVFDPSPWPFDVLLNPARSAGRPMVEQLAGQETLQILFFDRFTGESLRRRLISMTGEFQQTLKQISRVTANYDTTPERWERTVKAVSGARRQA